MSDLTWLGTLLERVMEHAPGTRTPPEQWPKRYRYKCLACSDLGVEYYAHPEYPDRPYARPCIHCEMGRQTLEAWCGPGSRDRESRPGPWHDMSDEDIARIRARPCRHDDVNSLKG